MFLDADKVVSLIPASVIHDALAALPAGRAEQEQHG